MKKAIAIIPLGSGFRFARFVTQFNGDRPKTARLSGKDLALAP